MTQHRDDSSQPRGEPEQMVETTGQEAAIIDARALFGSAREITIKHEGALYRLKITRQGKLILNK